MERKDTGTDFVPRKPVVHALLHKVTKPVVIANAWRVELDEYKIPDVDNTLTRAMQIAHAAEEALVLVDIVRRHSGNLPLDIVLEIPAEIYLEAERSTNNS